MFADSVGFGQKNYLILQKLRRNPPAIAPPESAKVTFKTTCYCFAKILFETQSGGLNHLKPHRLNLFSEHAQNHLKTQLFQDIGMAMATKTPKYVCDKYHVDCRFEINCDSDASVDW